MLGRELVATYSNRSYAPPRERILIMPKKSSARSVKVKTSVSFFKIVMKGYPREKSRYLSFIGYPKTHFMVRRFN